MSGRILTIGPLDEPRILSLGSRLARGDHQECLDLGVDPLSALRAGQAGRFALCVLRGETQFPVGAFGVAADGIVWSLWADLTERERRYLREAAPGWIEGMAQNIQGGPLQNHVAVSNRQALLWIHRTGCFDVADTPHQIDGRDYLHFKTKADLNV